MRPSWSSVLKRHCGRHLFETRSRIKAAGRTTGFVVDFSDSLILFHVLDMDTFRLNGYRVIRSEDVKEYRALDKREFWQCRALRRFDIAPVRPAGISLASVPKLLASAAERYPLITIHTERTKPDICYIGPLLGMTEATFTIDDLDCNGEWNGPRRLRFSDITRVDFGGGYEEALAVTAPKRRKRKQ
jgi:hypothetical protein